MNEKEKTVKKMMQVVGEEPETDVESTFYVEAGGEDEVIFDMPCMHYIIRNKLEEESRVDIWLTDAISIKLPAHAADFTPISMANQYGLSGLPLRIISTNVGMRLIIEAESVTKSKIGDGLFEMPKDKTYKITEVQGK